MLVVGGGHWLGFVVVFGSLVAVLGGQGTTVVVVSRGPTPWPGLLLQKSTLEHLLYLHVELQYLSMLPHHKAKLKHWRTSGKSAWAKQEATLAAQVA
jgi:hypothetical protein